MNTALYYHTPSLLKSEDLEAIFVQREPVLKRLITGIQESATTGNKHYALLIGPRGMGKTHMVSLVYHRVKDRPDLADRLRIAWLREDEYGVSTFLDLLIRIFRALDEEYHDKQLSLQVETLYELSPDRAEQQAERILVEYLGDQTLLILIENLDVIFSGLGDDGQHKLRAYIQNHACFTIVATAQGLFNGVSLQTSPFYGFFRIQHLQSFKLDDALVLLTKLAERRNDTELVDYLQTRTGRQRVGLVHRLAGGNPRVYMIFSRFLNRETLDELVEPFMQMLNDLTPYYQSRMQYLSPQQRKVIEFLVDTRGAVPVKTIAQRCFMTHQTTSSQLKDLLTKGYVQVHRVGRESFYELLEVLMRLSLETKKHRGQPIRLFVEFMRLWYTPDELEYMDQHAASPLEQMYVREALAMYKVDGLSVKNRQEEISSPNVNSFQDDELNELDHGLKLYEEGHYEEALAVYEKEIARGDTDAVFWNNMGAALGNLGRYDEALVAFEEAIVRDGSLILSYWNQSRTLLMLEEWEKTGDSLNEALYRSQGEENEGIVAHSTHSIILDLFIKKPNYEMVRDQFEMLVDVYETHDALDYLGTGLVKSLPVWFMPQIEASRRQEWLDMIMKVAGDREAFTVPLRLLNAAVEYHDKEDKRVLLGLPQEEREVLEDILGIGEKE